MLKLSRHATIAAALGGLLWTVKALVITARDASFDPLESVFFLGGMVLLLAAAVLVARGAIRRRSAAGAAATAALAAALVAATTAVTVAGQSLVRGLASGDNLGLEQEGGILLAGLLWLAIGGAAAIRPRASVPLAA